jgi:hypothetical protein
VLRIERSRMTDSWRTILERAAENLSIDLAERPVGFPNPVIAHQRRFEKPVPRALTFAETRELLAQELEAMTPAETKAPGARILQDVGRRRTKSKPRTIPPEPVSMHPHAQPPQPPMKAAGTGGRFIAMTLSVAIVCFALYGIYLFLQ